MKLLLALAVLAFPLSLTAQPANELGVFVSLPKFDSTTIVDPELGIEIELDFDEDMGYGVSYNRYWTPNLSTEFAVQNLGGDLEATVTDGTTRITVDAGEINLMAYSGTVQWHFARGGRFAPYVGGGVAYMTGDIDIPSDPDDPDFVENIDLDNETTWLVNAGVNIGITDSIALAGDVKYISYDPKAEGDTDEGRVDVNPLIFSAGVKFRF